MLLPLNIFEFSEEKKLIIRIRYPCRNGVDNILEVKKLLSLIGLKVTNNHEQWIRKVSCSSYVPNDLSLPFVAFNDGKLNIKRRVSFKIDAGNSFIVEIHFTFPND